MNDWKNPMASGKFMHVSASVQRRSQRFVGQMNLVIVCGRPDMVQSRGTHWLACEVSGRDGPGKAGGLGGLHAEWRVRNSDSGRSGAVLMQCS